MPNFISQAADAVRLMAEKYEPADSNPEIIEASDDLVIEADLSGTAASEVGSSFAGIFREAGQSIKNIAETALGHVDADGDGIADSVEAYEAEPAIGSETGTVVGEAAHDMDDDTAGEP